MDGGITAFATKAASPGRGPAGPAPTLRGRLFLLVAAVALPLLGLGAATTWQDYTQGRALAESRLLDRARSLALGVDREFERTEAVLRTLANSSALARDDLAGFEAEMRAEISSGVLPCLALLGGDAEVLVSTIEAPGERRVGPRGEQLARRVLVSGRAEVSDFNLNPVTRQWSIVVAVPVPGPVTGAAAPGAPGRATRVIASAMPRDRLREKLTDQRLPENWGAAVLDRTGTYVARLWNDEQMVGRRPGERTLAALAGAAEGFSGDGHRTLEGMSVVTAFARAPQTGYAVLVGMPTEAFYAPLRAALLRSLGVGVAVTLAGLLLALLLSRRILAAVQGVLRPEEAPPRVRLREVDEVARLLRCAQAQRDRAEAAQRERAAQIEATYAGAPVGLGLHDAELRWLAVNDRMAAINGHPAAAHRGRTPRELLPELAPLIEPVLRQVLESGRPVENQEVRTAGPGAARDFLASYHPVRDAAGAVAGVSTAVQEITELRRATAALEASKARFHGMAEAVPSLLFEGDADGGWSWASAAWAAYAGRPVERAHGAGWVAAVHPEDQPRVLPLWQEAVRGGTEFESRFRIRRRDGDWRWHLVRARPQRDGAAGGAGGRITRWLGAATDIHEVVLSESRLRLVAAELNHRVKNVLATVQAIAAQTSRATQGDSQGEAARSMADFNARLRSLGRAHELLTASFWEGARLDAVARAALAPWLEPAGPDGVAARRLELRCGAGEMPMLSPRQAQSVVLALHELATNAAKYGALSCPEGRVAVACRAGEDGQPTAAGIDWTETDGPPVEEAPRRSGFGTRMLQRVLARDLGPGAEVELRFAREGLRARIRFLPG